MRWQNEILMMTTDSQTVVSDATTRRALKIRDCGLADYRQTLRMQHVLCQERQRGRIPDTVLMVEHPSVITLGARQSRNRLLLSRTDLAQRHIDVVDIRRGGGATAHNPGQLVFYPILCLRQLGLGIREYIRTLERIGAELLRHLDVHSTTNNGFPGLWIEHRKIASIGVRVSRFTTYHGMAINIQNDLSLFDLIVPCGLDNVEMTSVLNETGERHSLAEVKHLLAGLLRDCFS